jgi:hypothetical protein
MVHIGKANCRLLNLGLIKIKFGEDRTSHRTKPVKLIMRMLMMMMVMMTTTLAISSTALNRYYLSSVLTEQLSVISIIAMYIYFD